MRYRDYKRPPPRVKRHVPVSADIGSLDVTFIDAPDTRFNPLGIRGVGEIGITGAAAAVCNAVWRATGVRVRDLPITLDKLWPTTRAEGGVDDSQAAQRRLSAVFAQGRFEDRQAPQPRHVSPHEKAEAHERAVQYFKPH